MDNLKRVIEELNSPKEYDGEMFESEFNFIIKEEDERIIIVDTNEYYHIDYVESQNSLMYDCCMEFGFEFKPMVDDRIMEKLEKAVKKDFGDDTYIEWLTNVEMIVVR